MNEVQEIDVEQIMERIRENIRRRRSAGDIPTPEPDTSPFLHGEVAADLDYLHSSYDINSMPLVSHRRILGSFVLFTKKVIRKLLAPILQRQVTYNAASARVATQLRDWLVAQGQISDALRQDIRALEARLRAELLAAESRLHEALATQALINEALLARQASLGEELGAVHASESTSRTSKGGTMSSTSAVAEENSSG